MTRSFAAFAPSAAAAAATLAAAATVATLVPGAALATETDTETTPVPFARHCEGANASFRYVLEFRPRGAEIVFLDALTGVELGRKAGVNLAEPAYLHRARVTVLADFRTLTGAGQFVFSYWDTPSEYWLQHDGIGLTRLACEG